MNIVTQGWLDSATDDLNNIKHIITEESLTNIVAFHAQQSVEKSFKALLSHHGQDVPKQHSTLTLYGLIGDYIDIFINEELLSTFDDLYIESRYPGNFGLLPYGKPTLVDAKEFYELALDIYDYIKRKIEY